MNEIVFNAFNSSVLDESSMKLILKNFLEDSFNNEIKEILFNTVETGEFSFYGHPQLETSMKVIFKDSCMLKKIKELSTDKNLNGDFNNLEIKINFGQSEMLDICKMALDNETGKNINLFLNQEKNYNQIENIYAYTLYFSINF